jgi:hypothetical protein
MYMHIFVYSTTEVFYSGRGFNTIYNLWYINNMCLFMIFRIYCHTTYRYIWLVVGVKQQIASF